jgi:putative transposase
MIADFIQRQTQESASLPVARMCEMVQLPRRSYYHMVGRTQPVDQYIELRDQIQKVALEWPSYGYRPMTAELRRRGLMVNHKLALRLMREDNLLCLPRRHFVQTTDWRHCLPVYPNLAGQMTFSSIDELWVAVITYIRLLREFVYLAVILDAYSRQCMG